jgi:uncharacterized protein YjbI with pentapeptide repeats
MESKQVQRKATPSLWVRKHTTLIIWLIIIVLIVITLFFSNQLAEYLKNLTFIQVLDSLSKLGILIAVINYLLGIPKREEQAKLEAERRQFEYWQVIDAAKSAREASPDGRFTSYALRMALQNLTKERDASGQPLKIRNVDFSGADLHEIDLANADLMVSQFRYTNLSGANFRRAKLGKATFARARLHGADFSEADLTVVSFNDALYDKATKFPKDFNPQIMGMHKIAPRAYLVEAALAYAMLWDAELERSDLRGANLEGAILGNANLKEANLQGASLAQARAAGINFQGANLRGANFTQANLYQARFNNADLQEANFQGARIQGGDFRGARNITQEQIKAAENWEQAIYDDEFRQELGLILNNQRIRG